MGMVRVVVERRRFGSAGRGSNGRSRPTSREDFITRIILLPIFLILCLLGGGLNDGKGRRGGVVLGFGFGGGNGSGSGSGGAISSHQSLLRSGGARGGERDVDSLRFRSTITAHRKKNHHSSSLAASRANISSSSSGEGREGALGAARPVWDEVGERRRFEGLAAEKFQHPVDQDATRALRRIPGLETLVRQVLEAAEAAIYLDNIASSILVGPMQMPSVYKLLEEACAILDMDVPELYVRQNPTPNAYTLAVNGRKPFIVLHTSLIDLMEPRELQAVIAHELGHIKCEHGVWISVANILTQGMYRSGFGLGAWVAETIGVRRLLYQWLRAAEFTCDRAAMLVAQDVEVVVSTLLKLVGGSVTQKGELSVQAFLEQAQAYAQASKSRLGRLVRDSQSESLSHPLPVVRAQELKKFSSSTQYFSLLRRSAPLSSFGEEEGEKGEKGRLQN